MRSISNLLTVIGTLILCLMMPAFTALPLRSAALERALPPVEKARPTVPLKSDAIDAQPEAAPLREVTLTRSFPASRDSYVSSYAPEVNFGIEPFVAVSAEPGLGDPVQTEAWLAFDLSGIPAWAAVSEATLHAAAHPGGVGEEAWVDVQPAQGPWEEETLTWDTRPGLGAPVDSRLILPDTDQVRWDVTGPAEGWVTGELENQGLALSGQSEGEDWMRFLRSRESAAPPELVVTYTLGTDALAFSGLVQYVPEPEEHPAQEINVGLYGSMDEYELGALLDEALTDGAGRYFLYTQATAYEFYTLVMDHAGYTVITALPGEGGVATAENHIRFTTPGAGHYTGNVFHVEPTEPAVWHTWVFSGFVSIETEPAAQVEVVLYGANADPHTPERVLAGASSGPDGSFRLPASLGPDEGFEYYVLKVADAELEATGAVAGPGGRVDDNHIIFEALEPGVYPDNEFAVNPAGGEQLSIRTVQQAELRPVVVAMLTPRCTCGFITTCVTITNPSVMTQFGQTLFNTSGDSARNYFLENSQGAFGLQQAGLFMVTPADDPNTASFDESTDCSFPGGPPKHRAYVAQRVLGQQLGFNFAPYDSDGDGVVEADELIVLLTTTDWHTGNARVRPSDPRRVRVGTVDVEVNYAFMQAGTDFSTIVHELAHTLPYPGGSDAPGDMYGGVGNAGTYGLMDNHCHGRINMLDPNTPYTPTQHIHSRRPHLDPWNKIALGWIEPVTITGSSWVALDPVAVDGEIYKLMSTTHDAKEYFLVENRHPASSQYETALPDSGLAIWHINENYLPDHRRAVALERAGGGANSGAGTDFCNDDQDNTALWDAVDSFYDGALTPNSDWYDGTDSGIAVLCNDAPRAEVLAYLTTNAPASVKEVDADEPNNAVEDAKAVSDGTYHRTLHAPCDRDYYTFTHWMQAALTVTIDAFYDSDYLSPAPAPQVRIADANLWATHEFLGTGVVTAELPFQGVATIEIQPSANAIYYRMVISSNQATIPPDRFDDQQPPGEVRNDSFAHSTAITETVDEWHVLIPGLEIRDLNLERATDVDYLTLQLPPQVNPTTGYSECLPSGDPRLSDPGTTQGFLKVLILPYFKRPFTIRTFRSNGSEFTQHDVHGPLSVDIECPHDHFSDGQVTLRLDDASGQVNFYDVAIYYNRWSQLIDFPEWLLDVDPPMLRPIPPIHDPRVRWVYPITPWVQEDLLNGHLGPPLPPEYVPFRWEQELPLTLDVLSTPGQALEVALLDAEGHLLAEAGPLPGAHILEMSPNNGQRLHAPDLTPGWYALAISGGESLTEYALEFALYPIYLPLTLRDGP